VGGRGGSFDRSGRYRPDLEIDEDRLEGGLENLERGSKPPRSDRGELVLLAFLCDFHLVRVGKRELSLADSPWKCDSDPALRFLEGGRSKSPSLRKPRS
jgi:hypothetical protein